MIELLTHLPQNMNTKNIKGLFEFFVLTTIPTEPMFAKEILERLNFAGIVTNQGTIYPLLNRLKQAKFIESAIGETQSGGIRKYYYLCPKGRKRLEELNTEWKNLNSMVHKLRRPPYKDR